MRCPAAMFDELPEGNYDISTFMDDNGDIIGIYIFYIILYYSIYNCNYRYNIFRDIYNPPLPFSYDL
jgi:hypothetical protein